MSVYRPTYTDKETGNRKKTGNAIPSRIWRDPYLAGPRDLFPANDPRK